MEEKEVDVTIKQEKKGNKLKEKIQELELEVASYKDKYLRSAAELDNFKKRVIQERINDRKYASTELISNLLVSLDQLDKIVNMDTDNELLKNFLIGFKMINEQIFNSLSEDGLKRIESVGKIFDPTIHHALEKTCNADYENGSIIEEIQKGYMYKDRVLKPAMVKVNEIVKDSNIDEPKEV